MFIRILPTTLLQIFCENLLYFQVIIKSMKIADDTFLGTLSVNGLNDREKEYVAVNRRDSPLRRGK